MYVQSYLYKKLNLIIVQGKDWVKHEMPSGTSRYMLFISFLLCWPICVAHCIVKLLRFSIFGYSFSWQNHVQFMQAPSYYEIKYWWLKQRPVSYLVMIVRKCLWLYGSNIKIYRGFKRQTKMKLSYTEIHKEHTK